MSSTTVVCGRNISKKFLALVHWARGGSLTIVTPFINDFDIRGKSVSSRILHIARMNSDLSFLVAPPSKPHRVHNGNEHLSCGACIGAAKKILLLDNYAKFAQDVRVKKNLHAKVYIADNHLGQPKCLTGSVNLTHQAFDVWCELGLYSSDKSLIGQVKSIIGVWIKEKDVPSLEYRIWRREFLKKYPPVRDLVERRVN